MKKIIQIFYLFLAVFTLIITGCQKESINPVTELAIDGEQKVISVGNNGIGIEFCLLNEQGEPATIFSEGENFRFHLVIKNNIKSYKTMYMPVGFGYGFIPDRFYVMNPQGDTIGRPFYFRGADYDLMKCFKMNKGENYVLDVSWTENRDYWHICNLYAHGSKNKPLPKGTYYISFEHNFCLRDFSLNFPEKAEELICTDILNFKINFEIK